MKAQPGTYALIMHCQTEGRSIEIGRLGGLVVCSGYYVYVGSALGAGGVRARVGRHLLAVKPRHWHLDYLRPNVVVSEVWCSYDPRRREHLWADLLSRGRRVRIPLPGFGASDCACPSHLFYDPQAPSLSGFSRRLRARDSHHGHVHRLLRPSIGVR